MQHIVKPTASTIEKVDVVIIPPACILNKVANNINNVVVIDLFINDIIRSRKVTNIVFMGLNH